MFKLKNLKKGNLAKYLFKIKQEVKNNIGYITFFHPAGNSFPSAQLKELVKLNQLKDGFHRFWIYQLL